MTRDPNMRLALLKDAQGMADNLRYSDYLEITELHGRKKTVKTLLTESIRKSPQAYAYVVDGQVLALGGCAYNFAPPYEGGVPWFVCSDEFVQKHRRLFLTTAPALVARFLKRYSRLTNFVHAENTQSIAWLKRLGFLVQEVPGSAFYQFVKER